MAEQRTIRAGMLDSERLLKCTLQERWLWLNIVFEADDLGLFEATAFKLARKADLPRDGEEPERMLQALADRDLIRLYVVDGKRYGFIPRFKQRMQFTQMRKPVPPLSVVFDEPDTISKINKLGFTPTVEHGGSTVEIGGPPMANGLKKKKKKKENTPPSPSVMDPPGGVEPKSRGTRLPADWVLPKAWGLWALDAYPHWTPGVVREIGASFADHWHAVTGRGAAKLDWAATWRNWCRSDIQQRRFPKPGQKTALSSDKEAQADRIMGSYAADVRAAEQRAIRPEQDTLDMEPPDA